MDVYNKPKVMHNESKFSNATLHVKVLLFKQQWSCTLYLKTSCCNNSLGIVAAIVVAFLEREEEAQGFEG